MAQQPEQKRQDALSTSFKKMIFATNVAESSLTIFDVGVVLDVGQHKQTYTSAHTGVQTIGRAQISKSEATQRAGRTGRTRPGTVDRLNDPQAFDNAPANPVSGIETGEVINVMVKVALASGSRHSWSARHFLRNCAQAVQDARSAAVETLDRDKEAKKRSRRRLRCTQYLDRLQSLLKRAWRPEDVKLITSTMDTWTTFNNLPINQPLSEDPNAVITETQGKRAKAVKSPPKLDEDLLSLKP